jgi:hypothetical protein
MFKFMSSIEGGDMRGGCCRFAAVVVAVAQLSLGCSDHPSQAASVALPGEPKPSPASEVRMALLKAKQAEADVSYAFRGVSDSSRSRAPMALAFTYR